MTRLAKQSAARWWFLVVLATALSNVSPAQAQTLTTLYSFQGQDDGHAPCAGVAMDSSGNTFGTTLWGGREDYGTVFELSASGFESVLYSFTPGAEGANPCAPLALGAGDVLYGSTTFSEPTYGTIFRLQRDEITAYYGFPGGLLGAFPSGLTIGSDGFFYGTTGNGGGGQCPGGCGIIYKIDLSGHETVLHLFDGPNGAYPTAPLIQDAEGNLYGTTSAGGLDNSNRLCLGGCGTVFMFSRSGKYTVLHKFNFGTSDGWAVASGVVRDEQGNLYGTTLGGGAWSYGTVYEITNTGEEKVLYSFAGPPDGATPGPIVIANGKLYGTTDNGGLVNCSGPSGGCGIIFEFNKSGNERVLHRFNGVTDGASPDGPVAFDTQGNMYGVTSGGPKDGCPFSHGGCGTIWKLSPPASNTR